MESKNKYMSGKAAQQSYLLLIIMCLLTMVLAFTAVAEESHENGEHGFHRHHAALIVGGIFDDYGENGISAGVGGIMSTALTSGLVWADLQNMPGATLSMSCSVSRCSFAHLRTGA